MVSPNPIPPKKNPVTISGNLDPVSTRTYMTKLKKHPIKMHDLVLKWCTTLSETQAMNINPAAFPIHINDTIEYEML